MVFGNLGHLPKKTSLAPAYLVGFTPFLILGKFSLLLRAIYP